MPILGANSSGGSRPSAPTIGSASDGGTGTTASVAFTPSSYIGKGTITYTATSSPGNFTATSASSPITVSGLTAGTAYTFTVTGTTNYGVASDNSAASNSVTPVTPSSFESIATAVSNGSSSALSFTSIPQTYKHLQIRFINKSTYTNSSLGWGNSLAIMTNGNSSVGRCHFLYGNSNSAVAENSNTGDYLQVYGAQMSSVSGTANMFSAGIIDIHDYSSTTKNKTFRSLAGLDRNQGSTFFGVALSSGFLDKTSAISSITIYSAFDNFASGSTFSLYGIKGE